MEQRKIGYAVLGLGIGMAHADAAYASENAELVAVCDINEARLARAMKKYPNITTYTAFEDLLKDSRVDIISICLPSAMHADFAIAAMEAGKHVLVEKPLDITPARAHLIEDARIRTGMTAGVVHQNRFNANMYPIKEALTSGEMGRIFLGTFGVKWYRDQAYYDNGGWHGTWEMDGGGSLMNQAVHTVDLMQWLMGDVASVTSAMGIYDHDIDTEDMTASLIKFKNGAAATFVSTTCAYPGISTEICLYGTEGSIEADGDALKVWKMKNAPDEEALEETMLSLYGEGNLSVLSREPKRLFGHAHVVEDMILAVRDGRDPEVMPAEALKSVTIVDAVYRSARSGETVFFA
ncbi:MAG: Gfo/Idh/MocA family oxidoreductase [Ruminococcaceae bacterium]|nr:Gfo/Idh/MocA family oxidoreductase [Oscillospiraceae bacterium]